MSSSATEIANRHSFTGTFTNEWDGNLTATSIITPPTGRKLAVKGVYVSTEGTSGRIRLYFTGDTVFSFTPTSGCGTIYVPLFKTGDVNEALKITTTLGADKNFFVLVHYSE